MLQFNNTEIAFKYRSDNDLRLGSILFRSMKSPFITRAGIAATKFSIRAHLPIGNLIKKTIFKQFLNCSSTIMSRYGEREIAIGPRMNRRLVDKPIAKSVSSLRYQRQYISDVHT